MNRAARRNPAKIPMSTPQSTAGENTDIPCMAALNKSTRYVKGEKYASVRASPCISARGTKMPEMKISGNRIRFEKIITLGGLSDPGETIRTPIAEQERVPMTNAKTNSPGFVIATGTNRELANHITRDIPIPKIAPAATSPRMMMSCVTGYERSRS